MTVYGITIERLNEETGELENVKTLTLIEQEGALISGTTFYEMAGTNNLVVKVPGESVFALAASAWNGYDRLVRKKEGLYEKA